MPAGDGLLVRVKPRGGALSVAQAAALAMLSDRFGNGTITLTGRANLQLRGIGEANLAALTEALGHLGLLDAKPEAEAVRNVVSSPLAGHDPSALLEIGAAVAALEDRLATEPVLWRLPAKFAWVVDHGGRFGLDGVTADVRFRAAAEAGRVGFSIHLGEEGERSAFCPAEDVPAAAAALAGAFLDLCAVHGIAPHRMRDLVEACGSASIMARAARSPGSGILPLPGNAAPDRAESPRLRGDARGLPTRHGGGSPIGRHADGGRSWVGVAPAFGRLHAGALEDFVRRVERVGGGDIRLTPWRSLLAVGLTEQGLRVWADVAAPSEIGGEVPGLSSGRLIVDPRDPRLGVAACVGAPACLRATTDVQGDAAALARGLTPGSSGHVALHVSGCAKGCAHPGRAPVTLVGRAGLYDLVRDGAAGAPPERRGLTLDDATAMLQAFAMEPAC